MSANKTPERYRFVHASLACKPALTYGTLACKPALTYSTLACKPALTYGTEIIKSKEESQQGDPLSSLAYCDAVQPTLLETNSRTKLG